MENKTLRIIFYSIFLVLLGTFLTPILYHSTNKGLQLVEAQAKKELGPAKQQAVSMEEAFQEVFE
ncbi:MAG: serine protease, partial [Leptospiraceae bacterium]|nr:serine protease [Leptospiraceae bacterium]